MFSQPYFSFRFRGFLTFVFLLVTWCNCDAQERASLNAHEGGVGSIAFSPDGKLLATVCKRGSLRLWDVKTGKPIKHWTSTDSMGWLDFSPDGKILAVATYEKRPIIKFLNPTTGQTEAILEKTGGLFSYSPDGKTLAAPSQTGDNAIHLWDTSSKTIRDRLAGHTKVVVTVVYSPDGKMLASIAQDNTLRLWDAKTLKQVSLFKGTGIGLMRAVAFSPDSKLLVWGNDLRPKVWDLSKGREVATLECEVYIGLAFSPDGKTLAVAGAGHISTVQDSAKCSEFTS